MLEIQKKKLGFTATEDTEQNYGGGLDKITHPADFAAERAKILQRRSKSNQ